MPARHELGEIFLGVTPKPVRDYLRNAFEAAREEGYGRVVIPCVGRFTVAEAAIDAGWKPEQLQLSDISLFSSVIGYAVARRPLADLGLAFRDEFDQFHRALESEQPCRVAAAVLVGLKLCQLNRDKTFERMVRQDILRRFDDYVEQVQGQVEALAARLEGSSYEMADLMRIVEINAPDRDAVLYVNPPSFAKGYAKLFDTKGLITWKAPDIAEFDAKQMRPRLYKDMLAAEALTMVFRGRYMDEGMPPYSVFAFEAKGRTDYVLANRPDELNRIAKPRRETKIGSADLPFLPDDHEIRPDSRLEYREVTKGQALYYRDLFAHKLGVTRAERYFVAMIDGYLMAVFGMFFSEVQRGQSRRVYETFGFCAPSKRYPRLNRLFMTSIVCEGARAFFQSRISGALLEIDYFQTTCLSTTPEQKVHRGSIKLHHKERLPDGRWKLVYGDPFKPWGFAKVIENWLARMRNIEQQTGKAMGVDLIPGAGAERGPEE